jgi:hypothetical protein
MFANEESYRDKNAQTQAAALTNKHFPNEVGI